MTEPNEQYPNFKKFSMYNDNEQTTASGSTERMDVPKEETPEEAAIANLFYTLRSKNEALRKAIEAIKSEISDKMRTSLSNPEYLSLEYLYEYIEQLMRDLHSTAPPEL